MAPEYTLRAAAVQLSSQAEVDENLATCGTLVREAAGAGAKLVLLPENFAYFGDDLGRARHAERLGDLSAPIQGALAAMARESALTVVGGGFPELSPDPNRPYNTAIVFSPAGQLVASYRKIHLFDVSAPDGIEYRESRTTTAGSELSVIGVEGAEVGLSICYDLRFPELYRGLVDRGTQVMLVPAAFTLATGKDHWHVLLRARAIESLSWVVAAAQWGQHPGGRATYGHSLVVDPWGTIVAECSDRVGLVVAEIDVDYLEEVRHRLPCLRHRQSSLR